MLSTGDVKSQSKLDNVFLSDAMERGLIGQALALDFDNDWAADHMDDGVCSVVQVFEMKLCLTIIWQAGHLCQQISTCA